MYILKDAYLNISHSEAIMSSVYYNGISTRLCNPYFLQNNGLNYKSYGTFITIYCDNYPILLLVLFSYHP